MLFSLNYTPAVDTFTRPLYYTDGIALSDGVKLGWLDKMNEELMARVLMKHRQSRVQRGEDARENYMVAQKLAPLVSGVAGLSASSSSKADTLNI